MNKDSGKTILIFRCLREEGFTGVNTVCFQMLPFFISLKA